MSTRSVGACFVLGLWSLVLLAGCDRPSFNTGAGCSLNSDCTQPLVCRIERCRRQCVDSRDCGAGLLCLRVGEMGGVCQLPEEADCSLTSECTTGLVCRFGTCTTACLEDRDCPPGASCSPDPANESATACIEPLAELCIYNSDCPPPLVCGPDQLCRLECVETRDCEYPRQCVSNLCMLPDGG